MRVYYIDSDFSIAAAVSDYAKTAGHQFMHAATAEDALTSLNECPLPDVIVLELGLHKNSGLEFLYEFRSYPDWHDIPVVLLTQAHTDHLAKPLQSLGVSAQLYKPKTTLHQLFRTLESLTHENA